MGERWYSWMRWWKFNNSDWTGLSVIFSRFVAKDIGRYLVVLVEGGGNLGRKCGYFRIGIGGRAV